MRTKRPSRNHSFLKAADALAEQSTCTRRAVGCILTNERHHILATGYNGAASGQPHCIDNPEGCPRSKSGEGFDKCPAIHAEENALVQCKDIWQVKTCYTTSSPCIGCIKKLLNTSCLHIKFAEEYPHPDAKKMWLKSSPVRTWQKIDLQSSIKTTRIGVPEDEPVIHPSPPLTTVEEPFYTVPKRTPRWPECIHCGRSTVACGCVCADL